MIWSEFWLAVGDVAELHQSGLAAGPMAGGVCQAGCTGDCKPCLVVAVEVADSDDPVRPCG